MKNVLVLSSGHCGKVTANGACARALVEEFRRQGLGTRVVCYNDADVPEKDGVISIRYHRNAVKPASNAAIRYWNIAKDLFGQMIAPKYDRQLAQQLFLEADKLCANEKIDAVIANYFAMVYPVELIEVGRMIKRKYPHIHFAIYELDSVADGIASQSKWQWITLPSYKRYLNRVYTEADSIFLMKSHESHWRSQHKQHESKLVLVDIPVLKPMQLPQPTRGSDRTVFLYGGLLDSSYRSPEGLLRTMEAIGNRIDWQLGFYSKGCEAVLQTAERKNGRVKLYGYVAPDVLDQAVADADVLLSIGNACSNSLPSKIITYMGYGKPIIHFSLQENDVCTEYLCRYPLALVIPHQEPCDQASQSILDFLEQCGGRRVAYKKIAAALAQNTPEYSVNKFRELIDQ